MCIPGSPVLVNAEHAPGQPGFVWVADMFGNIEDMRRGYSEFRETRSSGASQAWTPLSTFNDGGCDTHRNRR